MALIGQNQNNNFGLKAKDYRADNFGQDMPDLSHDQQFILQDFVHLYNQGLVERRDSTAILDIGDVVPGIMKLTLIGKSYYDFLSLNGMPVAEFHFLDFLKD